MKSAELIVADKQYRADRKSAIGKVKDIREILLIVKEKYDAALHEFREIDRLYGKLRKKILGDDARGGKG